ncbi:MAG: DUF2721 domain-containing protein [Bacteroidia bacterium]|nr:DUF2721 domain-containing protein [Bacteroidia bacterium]
MELSIVNLIQAMLSPGIMISACGLLLLSMNNRYFQVVNRVRMLDEEKRKLTTGTKHDERTADEQKRLDNIIIQIKKLSVRIKIIRDAIIAYTVAVGFFILSSFFIGIQFIMYIPYTDYVSLGSFLAGMIGVLVGVIMAAIEICEGYSVINTELHG